MFDGFFCFQLGVPNDWRNAKGGFLKGGGAKFRLKRNLGQGSRPQELSGLAREARTSRRTGSTSSSWTNSFYSFINATCSSGWQLLGVPFLTDFGDCNLGMQEPSARNPYKNCGSSMCAHVCSPAHCTEGAGVPKAGFPASNYEQVPAMQYVADYGGPGAQRDEIPKLR